MKLRFYLRGLGIGIAVTGLILMFVAGQKKTMSDEEIKQRASELGMVENQTLAELNEKQLEEMNNSEELTGEVLTEEPTVVPTDEPTEASTEEPTATPTLEPTVEPTVQPTEKPTEKPTVQPTEAPTVTPTVVPTEAPVKTGDKVTIVVNKGDGSGTVASRVKAAGLCDDAQEFDRFLMEKGYDKVLRVGSYDIDPSMSWDEIGATLCGR